MKVNRLFSRDPKKVMDLTPYAPAFRAYLERGGAFFIMDAIAGAVGWGHLKIPASGKWEVVCGCRLR